MGAGSSAVSRNLHHSVMMATAHGGTSDMERAADRCIRLNPRIIFDPDPDNHTTMLWEACKRGHQETMVMLKLLRKHSASKEEFVRTISWAHPQSGQNGLHVATCGRVAALLLLCGHTGLEQRELTKGMTPIVWNTFIGNYRVVATLQSWGTVETTRDTKIGANAEDHAHWISYPKVAGSDTCLEVLRGQHDTAQIAGVQWLHSADLMGELSKSGIDVVKHECLHPGTLKDHVLISTLPPELQNKAMLFDVDNSGSISYEELSKCDGVRSANYVFEKYGQRFL
jgi:hypothetical protein